MGEMALDIKVLQKYREDLKVGHGYLEAEILGVAAGLKDEALTQKLSIELQKIEQTSQDSARAALLKGDKRGILDAGMGRLSATQTLVDQHPQLKEALLTRQGEIQVLNFKRIDQRTGVVTQDRSAMYVSPDGHSISISPEELPQQALQKSDKFKLSEYEANVMLIGIQYSKLGTDLGLSLDAQDPSSGVQKVEPLPQKIKPSALEMQQ